MGLFKTDLYRHIAIGFAAGTVLVALSSAPDWQADFAGEAHAATATADAPTE